MDKFGEVAYRKITWRLLPILFCCYILAYLDRVNVGFAKLEMNAEPWFSDSVFALGSGIFFLGYFLFEVPGNLIMHRVGARIWITRIMITWGICSVLCAFSTDPIHFYFFRFLLGVAEAGFFPAIILYLTYWYPKKYRARIYAGFMMAVAFAGVIGSPLSGWILDSSKSFSVGLPWQWLFVIEGIPSILIGLLLPFLLTNKPSDARWLTEEEKKQIESDLKESSVVNSGKWFDAFKSSAVWLSTMTYFSFVMGLYGVSFWMPQIIQDIFKLDHTAVGWLTAIPWTCAAIGMILFGWSSDRRGDRKWHLIIASMVGMIAFFLSGNSSASPAVVLIALSVATTAVMCLVSTFWSVPTALLSGTAAAAGLAWINSVANLGGFLSPEMFSWLKNDFGLGAGLKATGLFIGLGGFFVFLLQKLTGKKI